MGHIKFINAGAGSGKTYRLTEQFCEELRNEAQPSEFILTTYTKAAAEEFRTKIKGKLIERGMREYMPLVDSAQIGTIHSVAQAYIEKYWYLLNMSPTLALKEEGEMQEFIAQLLEMVVTKEDLKFFYDYQRKMEITKKEGLATLPDADFWKAPVLKLVESLRLYGMGVECIADFERSSREIAEEMFAEYSLDMNELTSAAAKLKGYLDNVNGRAAQTAQAFWTDQVAPFIAKPSTDCKAILDFKNGTSKWIQEAPEEFFELVTKYVFAQHRPMVVACIERIFAIAKKLYTRIEDEKREKGILEFADLEILFRDLLKESTVRDDIGATVSFVFVDEFQDVSPIQLEIFKLLAEVVEHNCWVGDPKQAIYRFRGSDSALVKEVINTIPDIEPLETSYRSLEQLVTSANDMFVGAFGKLIEEDRIEGKYVKLKPCEKKIKEQDHCPDYRGNHHWWLSVPTRNGQSTDARKAAQIYPALASKLKHIFDEESLKVVDTDKKGDMHLRSLRFGDVAILTRKNIDCTRIADALRAKGIPVSALDERLDDQVEVKLVLTLMKYIARIDVKLTTAELRKLLDDASLETILRDLAEARECADLTALLDVLRERYAHHSVYEMVRELIAVLDLRHLVGKWGFAQKRQGNLDALLDMAASFVQKTGTASVAEFIQYVAAKKVDLPFDNTGDTVKVLTYHKSKGLQWKMVIMNSLHIDSLEKEDFFKKTFAGVNILRDHSGKVRLNLFPPIHGVQKYVDLAQLKKTGALYDYLAEKQRAEDLRLFYVGYTRAENYAVRLSFGEVPMKWLENIDITMGGEKEEITDSYDGACEAPAVSVIPRTHIAQTVERENKYISPSQMKTKEGEQLPKCTILAIAANTDTTRWEVEADVFGTCVHDYMAIHAWDPHSKEVQRQNLNRANTIISAFELGKYLTAETLVEQADALYAYIEKRFGEMATIGNEIPFTHRTKDGQVVSGEIDLYVKTTSGEGILIDFKNPLIPKGKVSDEVVSAKAISYWPQLKAYRHALTEAGEKVTHTFIYYAMLGTLAELEQD